MGAEFKQRIACTAVATLLIATLAASPQRSPDGVEMIAMVRGWFGEPSGVSPGYWLPLWPLLAFALGLDRSAEPAGYLLNVACAGGTAFCLYGLAARAAGSVVAALLTVTFALVPAIADQVSVLDARPLGWLLTTACADSLLSARGSAEHKGWIVAGSFAFLAPLARPEGLLPACAVAGVAAVEWVRARRAAQPMASARWDPRSWAILLFALGAGAATWLGRGRAWETLALPWTAVWQTGDILALYGFASAPTPYRDWVLANGSPVFGGSLPSIAEFWSGLSEVMLAHVAALGWVAVGAGTVGALLLARHHPLVPLVLLAPVLLLALSPQRAGQLSAVANVTTMVPLWFAFSAVVLGRFRWPWVLAGCVLVVGSARVEHARVPKGHFVEGSSLAAKVALRLVQHAAGVSEVACGFSSRAIVRDAGLRPAAWPSPFEGWSAPAGTVLLLSSVDVRGNDAGGVLSVAGQPAWELLELLTEGGEPGDRGHWYAILRRRAE